VRRATSIALAAAIAATVAGCGGRDSGTTTPNAEPPHAAHRERVTASTCPAGILDCRTTRGRIAYVQALDPDGDGDAHFVIVDAQGITLPGLTSIDVRRGLRPHPLPGPGDLISAAGPVQTGSYGQSQIHAIEIHVAGRSG
jgi:hypothetical protein